MDYARGFSVFYMIIYVLYTRKNKWAVRLVFSTRFWRYFESLSRLVMLWKILRMWSEWFDGVVKVEPLTLVRLASNSFDQFWYNFDKSLVILFHISFVKIFSCPWMFMLYTFKCLPAVTAIFFFHATIFDKFHVNIFQTPLNHFNV